MRRQLGVLEICLVSLKKCQFAVRYLAFNSKSGSVTAGDMHVFTMYICICVNMDYIYTYVCIYALLYLHMYPYEHRCTHTHTITCNFMPLTERIQCIS